MIPGWTFSNLRPNLDVWKRPRSRKDATMPQPKMPSGKLARLRDLRKFPDNQRFRCSDASVIDKHRMPGPFGCGVSCWVGAGLVRIHFVSGNRNLSAGYYDSSETVDLSSLAPMPGDIHHFTAPGLQQLNSRDNAEDGEMSAAAGECIRPGPR
jgi:hypothetical protein